MGIYKRLSLTARTMCQVLCGLFAGCLLLGLGVILLLYRFSSPLAFLLGLLLGFGLSLSKVVLLERMLLNSVDLEGDKARGYATLQSILRYLLTIAVLLLVVFFPGVFGLVGVIAGLLSLQLSAWITARILRDKNLDEAISD